MAEKATKGVARRINRKVRPITAAPRPTPTRPENAETKSLNGGRGQTVHDWTASAMGRSKNNGAGCRETTSASPTNRMPVTAEMVMKIPSMSPVHRLSVDFWDGLKIYLEERDSRRTGSAI